MNKITYLLCFLLVFTGSKAFSASVKGGSISYSCQGNNVYKISARINRECAGAGISSYQMNVFNGLGTVAMSASRVSIADVSPVCSKVGLPCTSPNQVSAPGVEEHVYEAPSILTPLLSAISCRTGPATARCISLLRPLAGILPSILCLMAVLYSRHG